MEYGSIERELHIDASPEVVFEVLSSPEHIRDWWSAETAFEPTMRRDGQPHLVGRGHGLKTSPHRSRSWRPTRHGCSRSAGRTTRQSWGEGQRVRATRCW